MRPFLLLLPLAGCLSEDAYPARVAERLCDRYDQCRPLELSQLYGDEDACVDDQQRGLEQLQASQDASGCGWDRDKASACLDAIEGPCDAFAPSDLLDLCARAWVCD